MANTKEDFWIKSNLWMNPSCSWCNTFVLEEVSSSPNHFRTGEAKHCWPNIIYEQQMEARSAKKKQFLSHLYIFIWVSTTFEKRELHRVSLVHNWRWDSNSDPIFFLGHDHRVTWNSNHFDLLLLSRLSEFYDLTNTKFMKGSKSLRMSSTARLPLILNLFVSSLVCADVRLNICFLFTRDSYKGFLLRHNFSSYIIVSQKTYTRD